MESENINFVERIIVGILFTIALVVIIISMFVGFGICYGELCGVSIFIHLTTIILFVVGIPAFILGSMAFIACMYIVYQSTVAFGVFFTGWKRTISEHVHIVIPPILLLLLTCASQAIGSAVFYIVEISPFNIASWLAGFLILLLMTPLILIIVVPAGILLYIGCK